MLSFNLLLWSLSLYSLIPSPVHSLALNVTRNVDRRRGNEAQFQRAISKPFTRTIVAIGDLHGDYNNALKALEISGVIDKNSLWTRNVDVLVQMGDTGQR